MSDVNFDLLDNTIDNLAELEAFEPIPAGTHRVIISWDTKDIGGAPVVVLGMEVVETIEMADLSQEAPAPGKKGDILFFLTKADGEPNTFGQGQLRETIETLAPTFGGESPRDVMDNSQSAEVAVTLSVSIDKKDPDKKYNRLKSLIVT